MIIKKANVADWKQYKEIRLDTLKNDPQAFSSTYEDALQFSDSRWKEILSDKNNSIYFAKVDDRVVGVARIAYNDIEETNDTAVLCGKYVKKEFRGLGIARKLEEYRLNELATNKNIRNVRVYVKKDNQANINLLKSLGFTQVAIKDDELVFEKRSIV